MIITIFGPPGSGKGTQAGALCVRYNLMHVSTGDLLRDERKNGTVIGHQADELMKQGRFVPDSMVAELVSRAIVQALNEGRGILLDGYPRNLNQLHTLDEMLGSEGLALNLGFNLAIDDEKLITRLTARRVCVNPTCHSVYNTVTRPSRVEGVCDKCGSETIQRADDRLEVIAHRLSEYHRQTEPILEALRRRGLMKSICANRSVDQVRADLDEMIEALQDDSVVTANRESRQADDSAAPSRD